MAGGWASDRWGRKATLIGMAAAGALLSLVIGWSTALPTIVVLVLAFLYGFAALGDSGVLSTAMADAVPSGQLGLLIALRPILGFRSAEQPSELPSLMRTSFAVFFLKKKNITT